MNQFFRRWRTGRLTAQKFSRRNAPESTSIRHHRAKRKRRLLAMITAAALAVTVPVIAATAAYGDEMWKAPAAIAVQEEAATQTQTQEEGTLTGEDTQGGAQQDPEGAQAQGEAVVDPQETPAAQTPAATEETQTPAATEETQTPAAQEETQTPAAQETQTPAAQEAQTPAAQEAQTPAAEETQTPAAEETQTPATDAAAQAQAQADAAAQAQAQADAAAQAQAQAAAQAQAQAAAQAPVPVQNEQQKQFTGDIQPGTESPLVALVQQRLMDLHYMDPDEPTQLFGPATQQAIGYFQRKHGLEVSNVGTYETLQKLFADDAMEYTVTVGASGTDVQEIQKRLNSLGYEVSATGYFGTDTDAAVKAFQKNNDLGVDGSVGYYTKEALYSEDAVTKSGGKAGSDGGSGSAQSGASSMVEAFIDQAYAQLGKPYVLGAKGPNAFDCSGLIYYCLNKAGYDIGYMTSGGWRSSGFQTIRSIGDLKRGDIICMNGHVAIYLGDGTVIDASSSQNAMVHRDFGSWFQNGFLLAKRVF
ncbi:MAG: peptidoglycan-binding protein [Christensenella sp.]|nr:peptidoglycan-binding protein [Christensenella sp.]